MVKMHYLLYLLPAVVLTLPYTHHAPHLQRRDINPTTFSNSTAAANGRASNVPANFDVHIISDITTPYASGQFYSNMLRALNELAYKSFNKRTRGFTSDDKSVIIKENSEQKLRYRHVVWGIQRVAEQFYDATNYRGIVGSVVQRDEKGMEEGQGSIIVKPATIFPPGGARAMTPTSKNVSLSSKSAINANMTAWRTNTLLLLIPRKGQNNLVVNPIDIAVRTLPGGRSMPQASIYLSLVRLSARNAETEPDDPAANFMVPDTELKTEVEFKQIKQGPTPEESVTSKYISAAAAEIGQQVLFREFDREIEARLYLEGESAGDPLAVLYLRRMGDGNDGGPGQGVATA